MTRESYRRVHADANDDRQIIICRRASRGPPNGEATAFGAIETFMENLAFQLGPAGVRAVCLRTTANVDSGAIQQTIAALSGAMNVPPDQTVARLANLNFLKRPARVSDTAKATVFLASDQARMLTGTVVNSSAGAAMD